MKSQKYFASLNYLLLFVGLIFSACNKAQENPTGSFLSSSVEFKVREKKGFLKYEFFTIKRVVSIQFIDQTTATVSFDAISKTNCKVTCNKGNITKNGIASIIYCGQLDFTDINQEAHSAEIEIWIRTQQNAGELRVELRQRQKMDAFPMAEITLIKQ